MKKNKLTEPKVNLQEFGYYTDGYVLYKGERFTPVNGIVTVEIDGKVRKFLFDKFVNFLNRNGKKRKNIFNKYQKTAKGHGAHRKKPVKVITPDNRELIFESSSEASRQLNICRTNIPHALSGRYAHVEGYKFNYLQ